MSNDQLAGTKPYSTYVAGLITEAGPLTYPENASTDELNCLLFRKGNRRRRLGIDYETDYSLSAASVGLAGIRDDAISTHEWTSVGGNGALNFSIIQIGDILHYYDLSSSPLGSNQEVASIMDSLHEVHDLVKLEEYDTVKQSAESLLGTPTKGSSNASTSEEVTDNDYLSKLQS